MSDRPENLRFLSGVILESADPAALVRFYRDLLGVPLTEEQHGDTDPHWSCELGDVHFAIHPATAPASPGPIKIAFMVFDLDALVSWLTSKGVELCYPPTDFGTESRITAILDPDGNEVELTSLGPGWLDHLRAHRAAGGDVITHWGKRA